MKILTVFSHPFRDKYPAAVMDAFHQPILAAGHSVDVLDLHQEGFDPRFTQEDHAHFWGGPLPEGIAAMHHRVTRADQLAFIFPVYWWSMPALMKGWIDRVFTGGWAYRYGKGANDRGKAPMDALLSNMPTLLIGIGGSKHQVYEKYRYDEAMRTQIDVGIFAYCGITDVSSQLIYDIEGDDNGQQRTAGLAQARELGAGFVDPRRQPQDAKAAHLRQR